MQYVENMHYTTSCSFRVAGEILWALVCDLYLYYPVA